MNLAACVEGHPAGDRSLAGEGWSRTYGELREDVATTRASLRGLGIGPGERVAILCGNGPAFVVSYLAVLGVGAVGVPLNPAAPAPEIARELGQVDPAAIVVEEATAAAAGAAGVVAMREGAAPGSWRLEAPPSGDRRLEQMRPGDGAVLMFTAGTAGGPRPARLTHQNMVSNLEQLGRHPSLRVERGDVALGALPLFHVFGLGVVLGSVLGSGASLVMQESFEPSAALGAVRDQSVTLLAGVPSMFEALTGVEGALKEDLVSVRRAVSGAAPLAPETQRSFTSRFGMPLWQGYGLTEAAPVVASSLVSGRPKPNSVGMPVPGVQLRLVDPEGADCLVGDPGEIWVRGPNVFPGYWRDEAATAEVLSADGWLRTGDVAVMDDEGDLLIVDRSKDLVIVSGFNVYPAEVEEVLESHPGVLEAAVIGVPSRSSGQGVKAFVVPREGSAVTDQALRDFCLERLARYKCPKEVAFAAGLPRGATGKLLRRQLR